MAHNNTLGDARRRLRLTLQEVADLVGASPAAVHHWETGHRKPRARFLFKLIEVLDLPPEMFGTRSPRATADEVSLEKIVYELAKLTGDKGIGAADRVVLARRLDKLRSDWDLLRQVKTVDHAIIPIAGQHARLLTEEETIAALASALQESRQCRIKSNHLIVAPNQRDFVERHFQKEISRGAVHLVVQDRQTGLGDAIQMVKPHLVERPFAVIFPDERPTGECLRSMIERFRDVHCSVIALVPLETPKAGERSPSMKYGIATFSNGNGATWVRQIREKPMWAPTKSEGQRERPDAVERNTRRLLGRYILTSEIFGLLDQTPPNVRTGMRELTDALNRLASLGGLAGFLYDGSIEMISVQVAIPNGWRRPSTDKS